MSLGNFRHIRDSTGAALQDFQLVVRLRAGSGFVTLGLNPRDSDRESPRRSALQQCLRTLACAWALPKRGCPAWRCGGRDRRKLLPVAQVGTVRSRPIRCDRTERARHCPCCLAGLRSTGPSAGQAERERGYPQMRGLVQSGPVGIAAQFPGARSWPGRHILRQRLSGGLLPNLVRPNGVRTWLLLTPPGCTALRPPRGHGCGMPPGVRCRGAWRAGSGRLGSGPRARDGADSGRACPCAHPNRTRPRSPADPSSSAPAARRGTAA